MATLQADLVTTLLTPPARFPSTPKTNLLTGTKHASFKGIPLHEFLTSFTDSRGPRSVKHEFPYRDGAIVETLGRKPHRTEWHIVFTGTDWLTKFKELSDSIDASPSGQLIHPIYGQMNVVCEGFERTSVNCAEALNTITIPLVFVEDNLADTINSVQGVAAKNQDVLDAVTTFQLSAADYRASATQVALLAELAVAYAAAAFDIVSTALSDPSLILRLNSVTIALITVQEVIAQDPVSLTRVAQTYDVLANAEVVLFRCLELADELALETSASIQYFVTGQTSIAVIAGALYGSNALSKIDQMLALNPKVDPAKIPAGTILTLPPV